MSEQGLINKRQRFRYSKKRCKQITFVLAFAFVIKVLATVLFTVGSRMTMSVALGAVSTVLRVMRTVVAVVGTMEGLLLGLR
jgi:hypothetical protein